MQQLSIESCYSPTDPKLTRLETNISPSTTAELKSNLLELGSSRTQTSLPFSSNFVTVHALVLEIGRHSEISTKSPFL